MSGDGYTRITLRLPDALHAHLTDEAARTSKSMNAEIVARLGSTFGVSPLDKSTAERLIESLQAFVAKQP
ncbi:toxin-antitoxin system HicB family antitoxin [Lysobacter capsici]|uniref:toxin-antitoxin system HicB family antitoxin n=1 Tax=Lysobacter capsici TaxID=435897 RepID=UPI001C0033D5|nr:toxin-antitoxin system HicB family antitoxin [Lysobacter capsici]QWF19307.1 type II toxin-antitoxin system HicB family antitoxin [Lysobacter capsici]